MLINVNEQRSVKLIACSAQPALLTSSTLEAILDMQWRVRVCVLILHLPYLQ